MSNDLTWFSHLESGKKAILPSIRRQIGALSLLRHSISKKAKLQLVNGLIVSRLSYIISIWGNTSDSAIRKAQVCLNTSARFVLNANKYTRETDLMIGCNWLNVRELTEYFSIIQLWKALRWNAPAYIRDKYSIEEEDTLRTDLPRLRITREGWRTRTKDRLNALPYELHTELDIGKFKKCLKRYIKDRRDLEPEPEPD